MQHHLIQFPEITLQIPPRYYGSVGYYARMAACGKAVIGTGELYDKRTKAVHRCDIADTNGALQLTVPVAKPHGIKNARWTDVALSSHGAWWHVHRVSLESAYGRTPFFEYYIDRLMPFLRQETLEEYKTIAQLDLAIDAELRRILLIETEVTCGDFTQTDSEPHLEVELSPYYQVRGIRQGFMADLSVLDLIFNLGPEAPLYLRKAVPGRG